MLFHQNQKQEINDDEILLYGSWSLIVPDKHNIVWESLMFYYNIVDIYKLLKIIEYNSHQNRKKQIRQMYVSEIPYIRNQSSWILDYYKKEKMEGRRKEEENNKDNDTQ